MVTPSTVDWSLQASSDTKDLADLQASQGDAWYEDQKRALKEFLCGYVNAQPNCAAAMNKSVAPMGGNGNGGKILKVRWAYPGCGKSGGLRMAVVMYCDDERVVVAGAWRRKADPADTEIRAAADRARPATDSA